MRIKMLRLAAVALWAACEGPPTGQPDLAVDAPAPPTDLRSDEATQDAPPRDASPGEGTPLLCSPHQELTLAHHQMETLEPMQLVVRAPDVQGIVCAEQQPFFTFDDRDYDFSEDLSGKDLANDHLIRLHLPQSGDLSLLSSDRSDLVIFLFRDLEGDDCVDLEAHSSCHYPHAAGWSRWKSVTLRGLEAGTYWLAISSEKLSDPVRLLLSPPGAELCFNGINDDDDPAVDCGDADCAESIFCSEEICDNGADDNLDQWVDCQAFACWGTAHCQADGCGEVDLDLGTLTPGKVEQWTLDTSSATNRLDLRCGEPDKKDRVLSFLVEQPMLVQMTFDQHAADAHRVAVHMGGPGPETCADRRLWCLADTPEAEGNALDLASPPFFSTLYPNRYFVFFEAKQEGGPISGALFPDSACHDLWYNDPDQTFRPCPATSCEELHCEAINRSCSAPGGSPACGGCLPGFIEDHGRCVNASASSCGGPCRTAWDCKGAPGQILCSDRRAGGRCEAQNSPACEVDGLPCKDDPESICVVQNGSKRSCFERCDRDEECRPGFFCSAHKACRAITDCEARGNCNDPGQELTCDGGLCTRTPCEPNPCAAQANSTKECRSLYYPSDLGLKGGSLPLHFCICEPGYLWSLASQSCEAIACADPYIDLGEYTGEPISVQQNFCQQSAYPVFYRLTIPPLATVNFSAYTLNRSGDRALQLCAGFDSCQPAEFACPNIGWNVQIPHVKMISIKAEVRQIYVMVANTVTQEHRCDTFRLNVF